MFTVATFVLVGGGICAPVSRYVSTFCTSIYGISYVAVHIRRGRMRARVPAVTAYTNSMCQKTASARPEYRHTCVECGSLVRARATAIAGDDYCVMLRCYAVAVYVLYMRRCCPRFACLYSLCLDTRYTSMHILVHTHRERETHHTIHSHPIKAC